jgi:hypothetical protein
MRSRHVPGNLALSCARRAKAPTVRAAAERRRASAPRWTRAASEADSLRRLRKLVCDADRRIMRFSAFRSLRCRLQPDEANETGPMPGSAKSGTGLEASPLSRIALRSIRATAIAKTRARNAPRDRRSLPIARHPELPARGVGLEGCQLNRSGRRPSRLAGLAPQGDGKMLAPENWMPRRSRSGRCRRHS